MQMFRARCASCATVFDVIAIPAPLDVFVHAGKRSQCPMCSNHKGNTCAPPRDLTDAERTQRDGHGDVGIDPTAPLDPQGGLL